MKSERRPGFIPIWSLVVAIVAIVALGAGVYTLFLWKWRMEDEATKKTLDWIASERSIKDLQLLHYTSLHGPDLIGAGAKRIADDLDTGEKRYVIPTPHGVGKPVLVVLDPSGHWIKRIKPYDPEVDQLRTANLRVMLAVPVGPNSEILLAGYLGDEYEYTPTELAKLLARSGKFETELKVSQDSYPELVLRMTSAKAVPPEKAEAPSGR